MATSTGRPVHQCDGCKTEGIGYQRCKRCKLVYYCSKPCQRHDWPRHKVSCGGGHSDKTSSGKINDTANPFGCNVASVDDLIPYVIQYRRPLPFSVHPEHPENPEKPDVVGARNPENGLSQVVQYVSSCLPTTGTVLTNMDTVPHEWILQDSADPNELVLVVKIVKLDRYWIRHGIWVEDDKMQRAVIYFYLDSDCPLPYFQWEDMKPGNYVSLFAPVLHLFRDGQIGFRIDMADQVQVFCGCEECISSNFGSEPDMMTPNDDEMAW